MTYEDFVAAKRHSVGNFGIIPKWQPEGMFGYQKYVLDYTGKKGRCAVFLDTGLGKTIIEESLAYNFVKATNKRALILTPLAVAHQFISEAAKFGIDDIEYSKDGKFSKKIVVCNYERLDKFNPDDFGTVRLPVS